MFTRYAPVALVCLVVFVLAGLLEYAMGRSPLGPDGHFGLWEGNIWSSEQSQRFADVYSFSHFIHGLLFYTFLWLVARRLPLRYRLVGTLILEAAWEILENSPIIINRYREATMALGYVGDSIFNSLSDIFFVAIGFFFASRTRAWVSVAVIIALEFFTLWWVRDNLTLNVVMLLYPLDSIKEWQFLAQPLPQ